MIAMSHVFSKTCNYAVLLSILAMAIVTVGANGSLVAADPCIAQLSYPIMPTAYGYSNIQVIVPVSATCASISNAFTAVGDAYDTSTNTDLGSVNTLLIPVNGGSFSGQLAFSLPPVSLGHTVQISVSIYNGGQTAPGQYGTLLTTASEAVQLNPTNSQNVYYPPNQYLVQQQVTTVTSYVPQIIQQPLTGAYFGRQNTNSSLIQQPYARAPYSARQDTSWLVGLVIAVLIAVSVIAAVVFAVLGSRNRPLPPPMLPRKVHL
jgi:hypothetical protein